MIGDCTRCTRASSAFQKSRHTWRQAAQPHGRWCFASLNKGSGCGLAEGPCACCLVEEWEQKSVRALFLRATARSSRQLCSLCCVSSR